MHILFVIGSLGCGGAESQLLMLMRGLAGHGHVPQLFVLDADGPLRVEVEAAGIPVIDGGYRSRDVKLCRGFQLLRALWRLWRHLRCTRPEVIHGFLPLTNLFAAIAGRLAATPLIVTSRRALNFHQDRVPGWRYLDRLSCRLSHVVTANSEAVRADTLLREGGDPAKIRVIYNGLDAMRFQQAAPRRQTVRQSLGLDATHVVMIIVANLIPYKGHADLLQATARLLPQFPELRLLVVGQDRGIGDQLRAQARMLGVAQAVQWLGLRQDVPGLLAAADIYISASYEEGFSNALLEALAAGKAVVATHVGGTPEMLEQGELGILVEAGDIDGLAKALRGLLADPLRRAQLGRLAAAKVAQRYDIERMVEQYVVLYRDRAMRYAS